MTDIPPAGVLPPVAPGVTAEIVGALPPRLRGRLDAAVTKLSRRPVTRDGDDVVVAVDDETSLVLHAPGGCVTRAEDVRCGCLLAPACVHRAAAVSAAPVADPPEGTPSGDTPSGDTPPGAPGDAPPVTGTPPGGPGGHTAENAEKPAEAAPGGAAERAAPAAPSAGGAGPSTGDPAAVPATDPATVPGSAAPGADTSAAPAADPGARPIDAAARVAAAALWAAGTGVLEAGLTAGGAVVQAGLLRAAHTGRLAGLHRPAAAAVSVATGLRAARAGDPDHRLADLVDALADLLDTARRLAGPAAVWPDDPRGTARQAYAPAGALRLYGLFTEPVVTTGGHGGTVTLTVDAGGTLRTIADIAPGGADRAVGAAGRAVRLGGATLDPRALGRAGLVLSGATVSPSGRLGGGGGARAVRAGGVAWTDDPADALWREPLPAQIRRALDALALPSGARPAGADLVFADVTVLGPVRGTGGDRVATRCGDLVVDLLVAHDHPALAYRDNLRLLASAPGTRLRVAGRLEPAARPALRALAAGLPPAHEEGAGEGGAGAGPVLALAAERRGRVDLGLDRLTRAELPPAVARAESRPAESPPAEDDARTPLHHLDRRIRRAVTGGRRILAAGVEGGEGGHGGVDGGGRGDAGAAARLRAAGLPVAAALAEALAGAAADRGRDAFGRLLPPDADRFGAVWLAAVLYTRAATAELTRCAWEFT